jgi:hypothetical protein
MQVGDTRCAACNHQTDMGCVHANSVKKADEELQQMHHQVMLLLLRFGNGNW